MKKEINLEEIFDKMCEEMPWSFIGKEQIKPYILEAIKLGCSQCLDLAAENAELESRIYTDYTIKRENYGQEISIKGVSNGYWGVDIDSILQIKDWIK